MPHFFFRVRNGAVYFEDPDGEEFANIGEAQAQAVKRLRGIIARDVLEGILSMRSSIEIEDENRKPLMSVKFNEVVAPDFGGVGTSVLNSLARPWF